MYVKNVDIIRGGLLSKYLDDAQETITSGLFEFLWLLILLEYLFALIYNVNVSNIGSRS